MLFNQDIVSLSLSAILLSITGGLMYWNLHQWKRREVKRVQLHELNRKLQQAEVVIAQQHEQNSIMQRQIFHAQKMDALGRLTAGIAHDFNNFLGAILGYADFLQEDLTDQPDQQRFARNIHSAALQGRQLIDQMLDFVKKESGSKERINLSGLVQDVLMLVQGGFPQSVIFQTDIQNWEVEIEGYVGPLHQMMMNILVNAKDALNDEAGVIGVSVRTWPVIDPTLGFDRVIGTPMPNRNYAELTISDTGCGMDEVVLEKMLEPFFTTKPADRGTGLGLATIMNLLEQHHAVLRVRSKPGVGSVFSLLLPLAEAKLINEPDEYIARPEHMTGNWPQTVLLVDDQPALRDMFAGMLRRLGYAVLSASHGEEALAVMKEKGQVVSLILTDYTMPQITGIDLARQLRETGWRQPIILMSGYPPQKLEQNSGGDLSLFAAVLRKPLERQSLGQTMQQILSQNEA